MYIFDYYFGDGKFVIAYLIKNRKDLCSWFETSKTSFLVNNDDGMRKCLMALTCDSPLPAECTMRDEETPQSSTSTKSGWGTFAAIAFGIICFCIWNHYVLCVEYHTEEVEYHTCRGSQDAS